VCVFVQVTCLSEWMLEEGINYVLSAGEGIVELLREKLFAVSSIRGAINDEWKEGRKHNKHCIRA